MALAALIAGIVANIVGAWSVNHQRLLWRWTRERYTVAMPKLWHVRYHQSREPVLLENAESAVKIRLAFTGAEPEFAAWLKKNIRRSQ